MDNAEGSYQKFDRKIHNKNNPLGLKGRALGLYHRDKQRAKKSKEEEPIIAMPSVSIPNEIINDIQQKLLEASTTCEGTVSSEFQEYFKDTININFENFIEKKLFGRCEKKENQFIDNELLEDLQDKENNDRFKSILSKRRKLPVFTRKQELIQAIEESKVILVSGDTGCGKTTQIPQFILDNFIKNKEGSKCNIVCTQPRRISAITVSERVAWERCEKLGLSVGYQIRLESFKPREHGSITFLTTGTLLRQMESDPILQNISHIILDEIHERNVETDLLLGLLKTIHRYRPDLKIILMSATFCFERFAIYFNHCPIFQIHGTLYSVQEKYLEDILQEIRFTSFDEKKQNKSRKHLRADKEEYNDFSGLIEPYARSIRNKYSSDVIKSISNPNSEIINANLIKMLVFHISVNMPDGAILVFLPSYDKILKVFNAIKDSSEYKHRKYLIYPLHSMMPTADQKDVFITPPIGTRKIILATNIAETSITIDDVVYVINSGKSKISDYDIERNIQTLEEKWVTLANSHQRRGRAGRVTSGVCYNLYTKAREYTFDKFPLPEIVRSKLESIILSLKLMHINDVKSFLKTLLDPPEEKAVENGVNLLKRIDALDENECITPLGLHLARLPIDPQMGKMLLMAALFKCIDPITSVAASLSFKDAFYRPMGKEFMVDERKCNFANNCKSDHLMLANVIEDFRKAKEKRNDRNFCYHNFLSYNTLIQLEKMKSQLCQLLYDGKFLDSPETQSRISNTNSRNTTLLRAIIAAGLYPNIAYLRKTKVIRNRVEVEHLMSTPEDGKVKFHPSSTNSKQREFETRYFVYFLKQKSSAVFLLDSTMIDPMALIIFGDRIDLDNDTISMSSGYKFQSDQKTTNIILRVREMLHVLLQKKAMQPSPIGVNSKDALLLKAIKMLLSGNDTMDLDHHASNNFN